MTVAQAKEVLLLYRPGVDDARAPEVAEALALTKTDVELARWFTEHSAFQAAVRAKLRQIEIPAHLKQAILAGREEEQKIVRPDFTRPALWIAAAAAAIVIAAGIWSFSPKTTDRFANFQARMVSGAIREYRMDIRTNDIGAVRSDLASRGAPREYSIPKGLQRLTLTGGGALRWQDNPVAMVCFDRGDKQMLFLFVMNRAALKDPPAESPRLETVRGLSTVSWSDGDKTYLLAGPQEPEFASKYL